MHHALELPELLLVIVDFLKEKRSDLYHFGQANQAVWQVTEPEIWRNANGEALRGLLPPDIATSFGLQSRPVKDDEWSRFLHYGRHIHDLELTEMPFRKDHVQDVLVLLKGHPTPKLLMPNLTSLHMTLSQRHSLLAAPVLLQWSLSRICLHVDMRHRMETDIIKTLLSAVHAGPNMRLLRFILEGRVLVNLWSNSLDTTISGLLLDSMNLRDLRLKVVTDGIALFPILGSLPALQALDIVITSDSEPLAPYNLPDNSFPALRSLKIDSEESYYQPGILHLLESVTSPALAELHFFCEHGQVLHDVIQLLATRWNKSIACLRLSMSLLDEPGATFSQTVFSNLRPLLQCHSMRQFWMISDVFIPWNDARLAEMINAWPQLEAFWIDDGWAASQRITPLVTRTTIVAFTRLCPRLTHLRLSVNYNLPPVTIDMGNNEPSRLQHLHTDYSISSNPVAAADFVRQAFPALEGLTAVGSGMIPVAELLRTSTEADDPPDFDLGKSEVIAVD